MILKYINITAKQKYPVALKARNFRVATGLAFSVFGLGAAFGHIRDAVLHNNYSPYNVGPVLYIGDILVPVMILSLLLVRGILLTRTARFTFN